MDTVCSTSDRNDCSLHFICHCLGVTRAAVVEAVATGDLKTVREIRAHTGAGDGCTACHARLEKLLEEQGYASSSPIFSVK